MANPTDSELLRPYVPRLVVDWLRNTPTDILREVDGSLAFVDISGFTQLTERLARRGRVGAEEMSDTLNATFAALLAAAYDDGAGLDPVAGRTTKFMNEFTAGLSAAAASSGR